MALLWMDRTDERKEGVEMVRAAIIITAAIIMAGCTTVQPNGVVTRREIMQIVLTHKDCVCGGTFKMTKTTIGKKPMHKCDKCERGVVLDKNYPAVGYEPK